MTALRCKSRGSEYGDCPHTSVLVLTLLSDLNQREREHMRLERLAIDGETIVFLDKMRRTLMVFSIQVFLHAQPVPLLYFTCASIPCSTFATPLIVMEFHHWN